LMLLLRLGRSAPIQTFPQQGKEKNPHSSSKPPR